MFSKLLGYQGIWIAFLPAELLAALGFPAAIRLFAGKKLSMWLLEDNKYPTFSRSYRVSEEAAITARDAMKQFLMEEQIPRQTITEIMLTVEEMTMLLLGINPNKSVIVQYTASVEEDGIRLYERDNGKLYDLTADDAKIGTFRQYILSCVIENCTHRQYLLTMDYNRCIFYFPLSCQK